MKFGTCIDCGSKELIEESVHLCQKCQEIANRLYAWLDAALVTRREKLGHVTHERLEGMISDLSRAPGGPKDFGSFHVQVRAPELTWMILEILARRFVANTPRCGCAVNAPEADPAKHPCPCGDHCPVCAFNAGVDACQKRADLVLGKHFISFENLKSEKKDH